MAAILHTHVGGSRETAGGVVGGGRLPTGSASSSALNGKSDKVR